MAGTAALGAKPADFVARVKAMAMVANLILQEVLFRSGNRSEGVGKLNYYGLERVKPLDG
jgi:hypothetical protein